MSTSQRNDGGFTLLEVVVALAIAGLALVALFQAGGTGLFAADTSARAEEAVARAQSHIAAVGRDAALTAGQFTGNDGGGYRWRISVQPLAVRQASGSLDVSATAMALYIVEVEISWGDPGRTRSVVLKTLRLGTTGVTG
jgi:general secretion pathway protein I